MGKEHHGRADRMSRRLSGLAIHSPGVCVGAILEECLDNFPYCSARPRLGPHPRRALNPDGEPSVSNARGLAPADRSGTMALSLRLVCSARRLISCCPVAGLRHAGVSLPTRAMCHSATEMHCHLAAGQRKAWLSVRRLSWFAIGHPSHHLFAESLVLTSPQFHVGSQIVHSLLDRAQRSIKLILGYLALRKPLLLYLDTATIPFQEMRKHAFIATPM